MKPIVKTITSALLALTITSCDNRDSDHELTATDTGALKNISGELAAGAHGHGVAAVQAYLLKFGYLPNQQLSRYYPGWHPRVSRSPAAIGIYDEATAEAVRAFQEHAHLPPTGVVDQRTLALMKMDRCGVPEGTSTIDPTAKFALVADNWRGKTTLKWKLKNTDDVTLDQARTAAQNAFATWAAQTDMAFSEVTGAQTADITLEFLNIQNSNGTPNGAGDILADCQLPRGGQCRFDNAEMWSVAASTPAGSFDLQSIMIHEIGHGLGLHHSGFGAAVMFPFAQSGVQRRGLDIDDNVGISVLYDTWEPLSGLAKDIAVGGDGSAWAIGTNSVGSGDFGVFKFNGSGWQASNGGGVGIAVDPNGIPWIVNSAGNIFRRQSADPGVAGWDQIPGGAKDIAVGRDGSVWIIGGNSVGSGDFGVFKFNGSGWQASNGGGIRIAVGANGVPWIVNSAGNIFRRQSADPSSGGWEQLPGAAKDIGINEGNTDGGEYAWVIGTQSVGSAGDFGIYAWSKQPAIASSAFDPNGWRQANGGGAVTISVGPNGRPWIVNSVGKIFRARK